MTPPANPWFDPQVESEIGQRRAAAELVAIIDACRGLPPLAWTVTASGAVLAGRVIGRNHAGDAAFHLWRQALGLTPAIPATPPVDQHEGVYLRATGLRNRVRVNLAARVHPGIGEDHDAGDAHDARDEGKQP